MIKPFSDITPNQLNLIFFFYWYSHFRAQISAQASMDKLCDRPCGLYLQIILRKTSFVEARTWLGLALISFWKQFCPEKNIYSKFVNLLVPYEICLEYLQNIILNIASFIVEILYCKIKWKGKVQLKQMQRKETFEWK